MLSCSGLLIDVSHQMNLSRDNIGNLAKYVPPTIANGKVYMASFSSNVCVYGLLGGGTIANGTYKVINRNSGLVLDVDHQSTTNGSPLQQWIYNNGGNQHWAVTNIGGNQYRIVGVQSGRTLEVPGSSTANGTFLDILDWNNGANQKWTITPTSGGYNSVVNVNSGKSMEVFGGLGATTNGAPVDQWSGTQFNQQWSFQAP